MDGDHDHKRIFNRIYENNAWDFGSGPGSIEQFTVEYRIFLQDFMRRNKIKRVLDIGCGDWRSSRLIDWNGIAYTGADVSDVVLANAKKFARPGIKFIEANALTDPLPRADLLIVKDVMQHWSNADILRFLPKLKKFDHVLVTMGGGQKGILLRDGIVNRDIPTGSYRPVDLMQPPFNVKGDYIFWYLGYKEEPYFVFHLRRR